MDLEREIQIITLDIQQGKTDFVKGTKRILSLLDVVGRSEQFKCDCGCTNHYKNEIHDSVMCVDCGTVYARI